MKKISRLEILLGAAICLILLVFIKGVMGNNYAKTQTHARISPETTEVKPTSKTQIANPQTQSVRQIHSQNKSDISNDDICDDTCREDISKSLVTDGLLSLDMIARIRENPAAFARKLSTTPEILSDLLTTLKADEEDDNGTQIAALAVLQSFSDEDKLAIARTLTALNRDQDRIVGLELLELTLETQTGSVQKLNEILQNEAHQSVLAKAINIASNLPKEADSYNTVQALTKIIRFNPSDHSSGTALLAKVNIAPNSNLVYEDISASLASISNDKTAFGLTALQSALQRDDTAFASQGRWYDDLSLRESVRAIAENQQVSEETRSQAVQLLNNYFSDD